MDNEKQHINTMFMTTQDGIGILTSYNDLREEYNCYNVTCGIWFKISKITVNRNFESGFWFIP